jgi:quaternary ammonium compound-resistance protein SugE
MSVKQKNMAWIILFVAAAFEICWLYCVKYLDLGKIRQAPWSEFFSNPAAIKATLPLIGYIFFGLSNVILFSTACKTIPMAIAFGVWTSLTLIGATIVEMTIFGVQTSLTQIGFMACILVGIVGLKVNTAH